MPVSLASALRAACLAGAGLCGVMSQPAEAQYVLPYPVYPPGYIAPMPYPAPGYRLRRQEGMGPGQISHVLRARHGFLEIGRLERDGPVYVVQGIDRRGIPVSVVIDAYDGEILSRDRLGHLPAPVPPARSDEIAPPRAPKSAAATLPPQRPSGLGVQAAAPPAQGGVSAVAKAPAPAPAGVYPPPADPRLAEKLGAK